MKYLVSVLFKGWKPGIVVVQANSVDEAYFRAAQEPNVKKVNSFVFRTR
jgi:hypothetical protein